MSGQRAAGRRGPGRGQAGSPGARVPDARGETGGSGREVATAAGWTTRCGTGGRDGGTGARVGARGARGGGGAQPAAPRSWEDEWGASRVARAGGRDPPLRPPPRSRCPSPSKAPVTSREPHFSLLLKNYRSHAAH